MSHYISIDNMKIKLMELAALSLAGENLCKRYMYKSSFTIYDKPSYTKTLKLSVSESLIELAIKLRSFDDFSSVEQENTIDVYMNKTNKKQINLRYLCNKIIHADTFELDFVGNVNYHEELTWWGGQITMSGKYLKNSWCFFFDVSKFCDEAISYMYLLESLIEDRQNNANDLLAHR